jgi:hypothetical protein
MAYALRREQLDCLRVGDLQPLTDCRSDADCGEEVDGESVVARGDAAEVFECCRIRKTTIFPTLGGSGSYSG